MCPRTQSPLHPISVSGVELDICHDCGGVWFDRFELKKFDEPLVEDAEALLSLMEKHGRQDLDHSARLRCPRHPEVVMMRHFWSPKRQVEIDECPKCAGIWLDCGELMHIRSLYMLEADRTVAAQKMVAEVMASSGFTPGDGQRGAGKTETQRSLSGFFSFLFTRW